MIVSELIEILSTYNPSWTVVFDAGNDKYLTPEESSAASMILTRKQEYVRCRGPHGGETSVVVIG